MGCLQLTYPSGMPRLKVAWNSLNINRKGCAGAYRFGFNSMEKDDEWTGVTGSHLDFGARIYDSRINRFLSIDPRWREFADMSSYVYAANSPIAMIDEEGKGPKVTITDNTVMVEAKIYLYSDGDVKKEAIEAALKNNLNNGEYTFETKGILSKGFKEEKVNITYKLQIEVISKDEASMKIKEAHEAKDASVNFYAVTSDKIDGTGNEYGSPGLNRGAINLDDLAGESGMFYLGHGVLHNAGMEHTENKNDMIFPASLSSNTDGLSSNDVQSLINISLNQGESEQLNVTKMKTDATIGSTTDQLIDVNKNPQNSK